mmetsp:Transcript_23712/g.44008  ORF Transcript_23712/g.44008 Transcript_23712/m.44008 type:complete len:85 (+) Transcript_23712:400-654(+)
MKTPCYPTDKVDPVLLSIAAPQSDHLQQHTNMLLHSKDMEDLVISTIVTLLTYRHEQLLNKQIHSKDKEALELLTTVKLPDSNY